jgi:RNA polymerase sigma factor (sigma-70 family)
MSRRRGRVEDAARRRLGMQPVAVVDETLERVAALFADDELQRLLEVLAPDQRQAVLARVVDEHDYAEIAAGLRCSQSVVRQRVSRGLARLRNEMEGRS